MNPEHDRQTTSILGREHVEEETILSDILILCARLELRVAERILRALRAVLTSIDDAASVEKRSLRSLPSKIAGRGSGEANTFPRVDVGGGIVSTLVFGVAKVDGEIVIHGSGLALDQKIGERLRRDRRGGDGGEAAQGERQEEEAALKQGERLHDNER